MRSIDLFFDGGGRLLFCGGAGVMVVGEVGGGIIWKYIKGTEIGSFFCYVALWGRLRRGRGLWGGVAFLLGWGCVLPVAINDYLCLIDIDLAPVAIMVIPFVGLEHYIIVECLSWLYGYGCLKLGFGFASKTRYFSYPAVMRVGGPDKANSFECCALRCIGFSVDGYAFFCRRK